MVLESFANIIGCAVVREVPLSGYWGEYDVLSHEVRLHPRLIGIQAQAVLAHELGHAAYRHGASTVSNEREADALSDWLRIPFCKFLQATQLYSDVQTVAQELDVLPADVRRYARRIWG